MAHEYEVSGTTYEFPDDFSDEKVQQILSKQGVIKATGPSRQRNEGAGKPKHQETLEEGLSKEGTIAQPVLRAMFTPVTGAIRAGKGAQQVVTAPTMREKARGATDVLRGGLDIASPYAVEGLAMAPLKTFMALASGSLTGEVVEKGAEAAGVPDEYSELAGTTAGIVAGTGAARELSGRDLRPKGSSTRTTPRPPLRDAVAAGIKEAKAASTAKAKVPFLNVEMEAPAWKANAATGATVGWKVGGLPGAVKGGVIGAAIPGVRGFARGAYEAYRQPTTPTPPPPTGLTGQATAPSSVPPVTPVKPYNYAPPIASTGPLPTPEAPPAPPTAADTSVEAWEANKGKVAKQARKFTPGSEDFSPPSVKPKGPKPVEEPKVDKADYKLVRGKSSGQRSSGANPGEQFSPPSARVKTRSSTPTPPGGEEAETTAAPTEKPAGEPTGKVYKDLPPKQYEDAVLGDISVSRAAIVKKLLDRPDAAKLAAKPRSWWADRKNWKGELGLKTAPSEETLNAFLKGLGWTGAPPK